MPTWFILSSQSLLYQNMKYQVLITRHKSGFSKKTSKHHSADRAYVTKDIKTLNLEKKRLFRESKHEQANKLKKQNLANDKKCGP